MIETFSKMNAWMVCIVHTMVIYACIYTQTLHLCIHNRIYRGCLCLDKSFEHSLESHESTSNMVFVFA